MAGSCTLPAVLSDDLADLESTTTLLTKLHELRKTPPKSSHSMTESIKKKVESQLAATPSSPCLSTATQDSGVNSRESTHSLTPRDGSRDESCSPVFEAEAKSWLTDKEIAAAAEPGKERELERWAAPGDVEGTLEELSAKVAATGHWDQFKANAELFGYVSTFKEDLSQYTTIIDISKVPVHARKKADRLAKEIEVRHGMRGTAADEEVAGRDEESLFSAVSQGCDLLQDDVRKGQGQGVGVQANHEDTSLDKRCFPEKVHRPESQKVAGSFFHVDGVGLLDENLVRSNPWMLDQSSARGMPMSLGSPALLSTQPQNLATASVDSSLALSTLLSTAPVCTPHLPFGRVPQVLPAGAGVVIDGLMTSPTFNGLHGVVESYDAESNRYNVQLPLMDSFGASQVAKIRAENLKLYPGPQC